MSEAPDFDKYPESVFHSKFSANMHREPMKGLEETVEYRRVWECESQWVSVEDALPKDGEYVLVYHRAYAWIHVGYLHLDRWRTDDNSDYNYDRIPTHWMPIPQPPEDET